ncbi:MAG: hypothetical protein HZY76_11365 [Anaerolineae bacterium]|nr:MAG: hypothetical protein HZY76_11365 [Anaerolineae bacterium]
MTVTPAQFGSGVAKLGVTVRQLGNTPLLWANITLTTPQETRVVPVVAQWQDAPAATVTPAQVHPGSSASMQQPTQMGITRETAPAASPRRRSVQLRAARKIT